MTHAPRPLLLALAFIGAVGLGAARRAGAQTELPKSSPFMTAGGPAAVSVAGEVIEFAAVRTIGTRTEIDLYDTQVKKNHWIPLGETIDGMTVMNFDPRHDQVTAKIGGVNKVLKLRQARGTAAGGMAINPAPAMSFANPDAFIQKVQPPPPPSEGMGSSVVAADVKGVADAPVAPATSAATPAQPAVPLTIARQEEEARMLVSDLLEIGMAQRKAYEEKQKRAADPNAAAETPANTPAPNPNGPPGGG